MEWSDRNTILAHAAQYDLQLARSAPEKIGQPAFAWRWHDREMGRAFPTATSRSTGWLNGSTPTRRNKSCPGRHPEALAPALSDRRTIPDGLLAPRNWKPSGRRSSALG